MAQTLTEKILKSHLVEPSELPGRGEDIAIRMDQTLTQDATGTMAYLQFETIGLDRVKTELSVSYIDHNTLQVDFRNMDDHRYLQSIAERYGLWFSRAGNGICHQVHLERFGVPGKTLLGSDSHTPTGGGIGMIAIGAGGLDVAVAMGGGAFHLNMPKIIGVKLTGELRTGVSAKDVILEVLRRETVKGGVGSVYEYFGPGVVALSVPQRATITNMGAELGATCSIFPSDSVTRDFLVQMGRPGDFTALAADEGAIYDRVIEIDLSSLNPLAAQPHSPDAVVPVAEIAGKKVSQVVIGSCTNSSLRDLTAVAAIVKGKTIAPDVEAGIAPGSRQTLMQAEKTGVLGELIRAGFRILESACGPCIGMGFAPNSGGVSLRTFNRNFKGRSGTADAEVYLVSPETAAAAAITGVITDPLSENKDITENSKLFEADISGIHDDDMLVPPLGPEKAKKVEIVRGPNIKPCPTSPELPDSLSLPVLLKTGDNVSTDDIMPAGAKVLPLRSNIPEISKFTFERLDPDFYDRAKNTDGCFVVGGENYGQGSSREHAALAPMYLGVRAVIVKSFARIHRANLVNYGILPLVFEDPALYDAISRDDILELTGIHQSLEQGGPFKFRRVSDGLQFTAKNDLDKRSRDILLAGGRVAYTRKGGQ
ncbi:aconitate hydratase [Brucepastera parasyntrophica]|uniref:aconitate hydratase n=1 Tax=Brucepastera parasyntrophica TaxID=2880008 RepID=UPI00210C5344|nr:aconitate hydratase [Brucepastera parasyntrophica]ULQ60150.1 aconitate hydratase [Brucepastera parasyntrophica]